MIDPDKVKDVDSSPLVLHVRGVTAFGGGPEKTILNSPRFLKGLGYRSICAYMHPPGDDGFAILRDRADAAQATLAPVVDRGPLDWRVAKDLIRICRTEKVAIWHGHDYKSNALGLVVKRFWPMKLITTVHGWVYHTRRTPLYYGIDRACLRYYDDVLCVSEDLYAACRQLGIPESRCHLIQNGIDTDQCRRRSDVGQAKRQLGIADHTTLLGAVGRLEHEKGFDLLIQAVGTLIDSGQDIAVWIAGEGSARAELQRLIDSHGYGDRVRLLGQVDDLLPIYEAMDVFVLSSRREGLPNVVLEAMAMGVPVVASRVAGVPSLLQDGENGVLVERESIDGLTKGIRRLLDDQNLCTRLARAGRATVEQSFSFGQRMDKVAQIYDRRLQRPAATKRNTAPQSNHDTHACPKR